MRLLDNLFLLREKRVESDAVEMVLEPNPQHFIYSAHFPGNPITPGVCLIQVAGELLSQHLNRSLTLKEIKNVKFLSVLVPKAGNEVCYRFSSIVVEGLCCKVQVVIADSTTCYAKMSLLFSD